MNLSIMNFVARPKIKSKLPIIIVEATSVVITAHDTLNTLLGFIQVISLIISNTVSPLNKFFCHFFQDFVT